jgi:hypothetical protein
MGSGPQPLSLTQIVKHEVNVITKIDIDLEAIRSSCLVAYKVHLINKPNFFKISPYNFPIPFSYPPTWI